MKLDIKFNNLQNALNESGATLKFRYGLKSNKNLENLIKNFNKNGMLEQLNKKPPSFIGGLMFFNNIFVLGRYTKDIKNKNLIHFSKCSYIENDIDNVELFLPKSDIIFNQNGEFIKPFTPCPSCLDITNWNNYLIAENWAKRIVIRQFNILHFHDHLFSLQRELLSKIHTKNTISMLPNNYLRVLEKIKAKKKWICEACKLDTSGMKKLFHILSKSDNKFTENDLDYYGICALCLKKANIYIIVFPEEYEYFNKNFT